MTTPRTTADARLPLTANFHFIKSCNFRCTYCYATFADLIGKPVLPEDQVLAITRLLARSYSKVTVVGGEPTLYPGLLTMLSVAKDEGALTNVVTNGSRIDAAWLRSVAGRLDFLTLSIDSASEDRHRTLGRSNRRGQVLPSEHYLRLAEAARTLGITVKVNTVVTTVNASEDMSDLIIAIDPERWKILQAAPVKGQNDQYIGDLTPARGAFDAYVARNGAALEATEIRVVAEPVEMIRGSYIMVDPKGRFFDSTTGTHQYSRPILEDGIEAAFSDVSFDATKFYARAGDADYATPPDTRNGRMATR